MTDDGEASSGPREAYADVSERLHPLLRSAALSLARRWEEDGGVPEEFGRALTAVAHAARPQADPADARGESAGELALRRRVLDRLRAELLNLPPEDSDPGERVEILRRLERVAEVLEPSWREDFVTNLLGPDGPHLVLGVTHDLRSPLSSILLLSDALRSSGGEDVRRQAGLIYSAAQSMLSMLDDVLDFCAAPEPPGRSTFHLSEVVESVRDLVGPMAEGKDLSLRVSSPDAGPRLGRPGPLRRVLLNLVSNAIKFTEEGTVELRVEARPGDAFLFAVEDTGPGIPDHVRRNLWRAFRTMEGQRGLRFSASGLGLSVARGLLESMGSELELETEPGEGARFSFVLELPRPSAT